MNISKAVMYDVRDFFSSWITWLFLFFTVTPPVGVIIANLVNEDLSIEPMFLATGFGSFGFMFVIISGIRMYSKDISQGTNILFMNNTTNRIKYIFTKLFSVMFVGLFYGALLVLILAIAHFLFDIPIGFSGMSVWTVILKALLGYLGATLVFSMLMLFLSLFIRSSVFIFLTTVLMIMLVPIVYQLSVQVYTAYKGSVPETFTDFYSKYLPFEAIEHLSFLSTTQTQMIMLFVYGVIFLVLSITFVRKRDY